jgi:hypothetical protein
MALETVVFQQDPSSTLGLGATWIHGFGLEGEKANYHETLNTTISNIGSDFHPNNSWDTNNSSSQEISCACKGGFFTGGNAAGRRKRQRRISIKDEAEVAHQRMTHIKVERNRRKQMNDYLTVIRSMMPPSYVQRVRPFSLLSFFFPLLFILIRLNPCSKKYLEIFRSTSLCRINSFKRKTACMAPCFRLKCLALHSQTT